MRETVSNNFSLAKRDENLERLNIVETIHKFLLNLFSRSSPQWLPLFDRILPLFPTS